MKISHVFSLKNLLKNIINIININHIFMILIMVISLGFLWIMVCAPLWAMLHYQDNSLLFKELLSDEYYLWRIKWTVIQASLSAILCAILAIPTAWALARLDFFGRKMMLRLLMLPFVMPTLVAGMGILALFGEHGWLWRGWADTPYLLFYGNIFFNLPVAVRAVYQGLHTVPASRLVAAQLLGANAWQVFWRVEWAAIKIWLIGAICLIFLYCFSGFGLALLLGGQRYATIEVEIYQLIAYELDMARAGVLVWLVLAITAIAGGIYAYVSRKSHQNQSNQAQSHLNQIQTQLPKKPQSIQEYSLILLAILISGLICLLPLFSILFSVIFKLINNNNNNNFKILWEILSDEETILAMTNTLKFTFSAMILAVILGLSHAIVARKWAWLRGLTFLPFMVSPVCLAFGVLLVYPEWAASLILLLSLYALLAYPFVTKDILSAWDSLPSQYERVARLSGANRFQVGIRVILPILFPALRRGLTMAAATGVGEFAATLFLSRPEWLTLTTLIYQKLGRVGERNLDEAMILSCILMILAVVVFVILDVSEQKSSSSHSKY